MEPPAASMKPVIEPNFIAIEGAIGAGKTSLVNLLGKQLDAKLVLENDDENPVCNVQRQSIESPGCLFFLPSIFS